MLGTPFGVDPDPWARASAVCAFRCINGYTRNDWMLSLVYRSSSFRRKVAGLSPVTMPPHTRAAQVTLETFTQPRTPKPETRPPNARTANARNLKTREAECETLTASNLVERCWKTWTLEDISPKP